MEKSVNEMDLNMRTLKAVDAVNAGRALGRQCNIKLTPEQEIKRKRLDDIRILKKAIEIRKQWQKDHPSTTVTTTSPSKKKKNPTKEGEGKKKATPSKKKKTAVEGGEGKKKKKKKKTRGNPHTDKV